MQVVFHLLPAIKIWMGSKTFGWTFSTWLQAHYSKVFPDPWKDEIPTDNLHSEQWCVITRLIAKRWIQYSIFNTCVWIIVLDLVLGSRAERFISIEEKHLPLSYRRGISTYFIPVCWLGYCARSHIFLSVFSGHLYKKEHDKKYRVAF